MLFTWLQLQEKYKTFIAEKVTFMKGDLYNSEKYCNGDI